MRLVLRLFWVALFVGILVLGWRFAGENGAEVQIRLPIGELPRVPVWQALLAAFGAGAAAMGLIGLYQLAKLRLTARRFRKTVRVLEAEVHQLRTLPLSGEEPPIEEAHEQAEAAPRGARQRGG
jgi:uncharacterized integral membrane protein